MESSGGEVNYWPGFVDALSNVVLTLIFVLVVFVFALVMASNKVDQKYKEILDAHEKKIKMVEVSEESIEEAEELRKKLQEAESQIRVLEKKLENMPDDPDQEIDILDSGLSKTAKAVVENEAKNKVSLKFSSSIVNMDEDSQKKLSDQLVKYQDILKDTNKKVLLKAYLDSDTYSIGQRLAYYRILEIRNFLISQAGVSPAQISSKIVDGKGKRAGYVEILFDQ